jgi:hypothetical protein
VHPDPESDASERAPTVVKHQPFSQVLIEGHGQFPHACRSALTEDASLQGLPEVEPFCDLAAKERRTGWIRCAQPSRKRRKDFNRTEKAQKETVATAFGMSRPNGGAQNSTLQERGLGPEIPLDLRRRLQYSQRPTPYYVNSNIPRTAISTWRKAIAASKKVVKHSPLARLTRRSDGAVGRA